MKLFQVIGGFCFKDYTLKYGTIKEASKYFDKNTKFIKAPDYVFEGWGYEETAKGDDRFIKPTPPDGFAYDDETGTFYKLIPGPEKRRHAYAYEPRIEFNNLTFSVNEAETEAAFYMFENTETAKNMVMILTEKITEAKKQIREDYPDEGGPYRI